MVHNIEALRERFYNLFSKLMGEYELEKALYEGMPEDVEDCWNKEREAVSDLHIWVGTGCTKFVIGDEDCDYIIKFQPPCLEEEHSNYDYCGREVEVYNAAVVEGFADKFAWCAKLFDYELEDGSKLPVYVMEYCQCSYESISDDMDDWHYSKFCTSRHIEKSDKAWEEYDNVKYDETFDERMMEWAYSVWGLDFNAIVEPGVKTIAQFMREMCINDIHCGNWGWCHNKLVLTDYSGYGCDLSNREIEY